MTDDLVARLRAVDHMSVEDCFLQSSLFAHAADRLEAAEARVRELEAENKRLAECLDLLAVGFGVPDGGRYIADWQTKIEKLKAAERALAEAYERAAEVADRPVIGFSDGAVEAARYIAAAIRKLAQEVKHEAE